MAYYNADIQISNFQASNLGNGKTVLLSWSVPRVDLIKFFVIELWDRNTQSWQPYDNFHGFISSANNENDPNPPQKVKFDITYGGTNVSFRVKSIAKTGEESEWSLTSVDVISFTIESGQVGGMEVSNTGITVGDPSGHTGTGGVSIEADGTIRTTHLYVGADGHFYSSGTGTTALSNQLLVSQGVSIIRGGLTSDTATVSESAVIAGTTVSSTGVTIAGHMSSDTGEIHGILNAYNINTGGVDIYKQTETQAGYINVGMIGNNTPNNTDQAISTGYVQIDGPITVKHILCKYANYLDNGLGDGGATIVNSNEPTIQALVISGNISDGTTVRKVKLYDDLWISNGLTTIGAVTFGGLLTASAGVSVIGNITATGKVYNAVYSDYAEYFLKDEDLEAGDVVCKNPNGNGYIKSPDAYNKLVVGVFSDEYSHCIGGDKDKDVTEQEAKYAPVGMVGRLKVKVWGKVEPGDLLVSSCIPGVAMAANRYIPGTVIGKSLKGHSGNTIDRLEMLILNM
jgi:hypothetical protein